MTKVLIVNAIFKGNDKRLKKNEVYHLEIRRGGAKQGYSSGNHDLVTVEDITYPYTLRGFLENWELKKIYD